MKDNITITCACGCNGSLLKYDSRGRKRAFLPSHWSKTQESQSIAMTCEQCGTAFHRIPSKRDRVKHQFCSQACAGAWATQHDIRKGENNGHYHTITVACAGCDAPVSKPQSLIKRRNNRVYCPECIPAYARRGRKGFYVGYPKEFSAELRRQIRRRDGYTCQECGAKQTNKTLQVHHIDYDKHHNDPRNLISLCSVCHGRTNWAMDTWKAHFTTLMHRRYPQLPAVSQ
jgi:5-methylcytosine-specific restriction endonuclease McrA